MSAHTIVIATRNSPLAMQQALWVKHKILEKYPALNIELLGLTTSADKLLHLSLTNFPGKGLFVKELEEALLDGRADLAVHSLKDVPMILPDGLILPVICEREDPRDVLVSNIYSNLSCLPEHAVIATASMRRQCQVRAMHPQLNLTVIRGNIQTRLQRLDNKELSALIIAAAGLKRLNLEHRITAYFPENIMLPAAGQGSLAVECRIDDQQTQKYIKHLHHQQSADCANAERALCQKLGATCKVPVAAYAKFTGQQILLSGLVGKLDGSKLLIAHGSATPENATILGHKVAQSLLDQGAEEILQNLLSSVSSQ